MQIVSRGRSWLEEGYLGADATQEVHEVGAELVGAEGGEVEAHGEALAEGLVDGHGQAAAQLGLAAEEQADAVVGAHRVVGEPPAHLRELVAAEALGLIEDEYGTGARRGHQARHLVLDLMVEGRTGALDGQAELPGDGLVEVHGVAGGERDVEDLVEAGMQAGGHGARRSSCRCRHRR